MFTLFTSISNSSPLYMWPLIGIDNEELFGSSIHVLFSTCKTFVVSVFRNWFHISTSFQRIYCMISPLCWKSNNPRARAPWRNYLPYESMAKSKCFWQNRIALTFCRFLQINPEKMTSLQMCRIKKITPCSIQTFWDRQLCFYVKKLFVSEKTQKSELFHFS